MRSVLRAALRVRQFGENELFQIRAGDLLLHNDDQSAIQSGHCYAPPSLSSPRGDWLEQPPARTLPVRCR